MQSTNFDPLKQRWPQLHKYGRQAEACAYSDPQSAIIKLRCFAEEIVGTLYQDLRLPCPTPDSFFDRLKVEEFQRLVDRSVIEKFHALRIVGNKAAHGRNVSAADALCLIKDAYLIGQWLYRTYNDGSDLVYPAFIAPKQSSEPDLPHVNEGRERQLHEALSELARLQQANQQAQAEINNLRESLDQARVRDIMDSAVRAATKIDFEVENTRSLIKIHDVYAEYELNQGQGELVDRLDQFLSTRDENIFLLKGYAGTGKTFITKGLTEYFRAIGRNFVLMAPTGKASKVISTKTRTGASTIHGAIYSFKDIIEYRDEDEDGTATYKFYADLAANDLSADTVFIVDEASMVSDNYQEAEFFRFGSGYVLRDLLKYINLDHNDHRKKIIFIGDNAQLPPVGMSSSPALSSDYLKREYHLASTEYELKEVVRQKSDSGVIENSIRLREAIRTKVFNQLTIVYSKPGVEKIEHRDFMPRYLEACCGKISANTIVIAHSNSDVAEFNQGIREHFFPESAEITRGDKIMAVTNTDAPGFFISNGDFGMVREVLGEPESRTITLKTKRPGFKEVLETSVTLTFRDMVLAFRDLEGTPQQFRAKIIEDLLYGTEANLSSDQTKALYIDFRIRHPDLKPRGVEFKNALRSDPYFNALRLKFGYAITCHKAQGSEWDHVFVKCKSHHNQLSADYFRWLYTAITRTSKSLYLLDAPDIKLGAGLKPVGTTSIGLGLSTSPVDSGNIAPNFESTPSAVSQETFGIPTDEHFLLAVLGKVVALLPSIPGVVVEDVVHNQYRESYIFVREGQHARIDINYNSKGKVTGVGAHRPSEFSTSLVELLSPLKGTLIAVVAAPSSEGPVFEHEFLETYHRGLAARMEDRGIAIDHVLQPAWCLRYTFKRSEEIAVFDIFYNGKHQFTKYAPVGPMSNSKMLLSDVSETLAQGFD